MPTKPLRCSWLAMARRRKLARTSGLGRWLRLSFGLLPGKSGSKIVRPLSGSLSFVPAKGARGKQNRLGVEDWDFPAKTKPPARGISLRRDQMLRHRNYCLGRGGRQTGKDIFQRHRAFRVGARPLLNLIDGGARCLGAQRASTLARAGRLRKRQTPLTGIYTNVKVLLPISKTYFRCH
jgi:hypothetical protein